MDTNELLETIKRRQVVLEEMLTELLCDQETLKEPYRNEALCEKARAVLYGNPAQDADIASATVPADQGGMSPIKVVVFAHDSNGEAALFPVIVKCTDDQRDEGEHYAAGIAAAEAAGYEGAMACDEDDSAGRTVGGCFNWADVRIIDIPQTLGAKP